MTLFLFSMNRVTLSLRMRFENDNMGIDCYINNKAIFNSFDRFQKIRGEKYYE